MSAVTASVRLFVALAFLPSDYSINATHVVVLHCSILTVCNVPSVTHRMIRSRLRTLEFFRCDDPMRSGSMSREKFGRSLLSTGFRVSPVELEVGGGGRCHHISESVHQWCATTATSDQSRFSQAVTI